MPLRARHLDVTSAGGRVNCIVRSRNDGIAMITRMITGTIVQATSINVLCVVFEGVGLAFSLNRQTT